MDCTHGKTRKKTRSVLSRRRSLLSFLISFPIVFSLPSFLSATCSTSVCAVKTVVSCCLTCTVYSSLTVSTALYCLHAARSGYSWRLDCNKKGIISKETKQSPGKRTQVFRFDLSGCVCFLPFCRRWLHWGLTGWRWTVRVSPCPRLQSISVWVQWSTHTHTGGFPSILSSKSTEEQCLEGDSLSSFLIFCVVFLLTLHCLCLFSPLTSSLLCLPVVPAVKPDRHHHVVRSEDGRLFYDNQWYCRGQAICINRKDEYPTRCVREKGVYEGLVLSYFKQISNLEAAWSHGVCFVM